MSQEVIVPCETGSIEEGIIIRKFSDGRRIDYDSDYYFKNQLRNQLIDDGLEAIVHSRPFYHPNDPYLAYHGLPVKKAE